MRNSQSTYPLRLPNSIKAEVVRLAKAEGTSINQFVATAVAEKRAAMNTATFFAERRTRADFDAFDRIMQRQGGEPPQPDDLIP
ncbi:MAG: toxin-antitoxin system HicB family antitoxin [Candidatus Accumulibacter sp.]|nr:toxin-antitoxin system HicB family antitoxin [Accumulibacter sp.]